MDLQNKFVALGAARYREAIGRIREPMSNKERVVAAQKRVIDPFIAALDAGAEPRIESARAIGKGSDMLFFLRLDDRIFPVLVETPDRGPRHVRITEPMPAGEFRSNTSLEKLYGRDPGELSAVELEKGYGLAQIRFGKASDFSGSGYADALWDVVSKTMIRATALDRDRRLQQEYEREDIVTFEKKSAPVTTRSVLAAGQPAKARWEGPPLGDTLVGAGAWRQQLVSVTAYADASKPVQPMIRTRVDDAWTWVPISLPEREDIPFGGCAVTIEGNTLHLWGGVDAGGEPVKAHWSYDLSKGAGKNFPPTLWKKDKSLDRASAWPVVAQQENQVFVGGGIEGFFANRKPDKSRAIRLDAKSGWSSRSPAPGDSDLVGCSAAMAKGIVFVGPGTSLDGVVRAYSDERAGAWFEFPLPEKVGCGQIEVIDARHLQYRGGFYEDGAPCTGIWELDLASPDPKWERTGDSDYVIGSSRVVDLGVSIVSITVTPNGKQCFTLD